MADESDDNVPQRDPASPEPAPREPAASRPAKSGGGSTVAVFLSFIALAASIGSTGWMLTRVQPAVRESAAASSALAASVLLAREQSSLGARLRGPVTWAVAGALAVLVLSAVLLYLVVTPEDLLRPLVVVVDRIESWVITRGGL